ncbi:PAS domain-containing sensor histidine kinase [Fodinibius sediminis]|uniref:histidine kinase n=1 Tax=Fodinibius sediminis TaxID=1214077 RepID=A0A521DM33_9BACT|nr:PAS domain S-box protein [Fodinibius sediminis]SMO72779.1 PAS domain S-box-containing protein [Fodinibius sediminis]
MPHNNIDLYFEENPNPMWIFERDTLRIIDVNESALSLYGYHREEMLSLRITDLRTKEEIPKLLESVTTEIQSFQDAGVWRHKTKAGDEIYVNILSYPIKVEEKKCELVLAKDITELKKTQEKLDRREKIFEILSENVAGTFFVFDSNGKMLQWNNYVEEITNYTAKEISEMNALDFVDDGEKEKISDAILETLQSGFVEVQGKLKGKFGKETPLLFKASCVEIDNRSCIVGIGIDISNLLKAQKDAQEHLELLQTIIDNSESVMYLKDNQNRLAFVNDAFAELFDINKNEVIGKKDTGLIGPEQAKKVKENDDLVRYNGHAKNFEEVLEIDGETRTFLSTKTVINGIQKYDGFIFGISTDITEKKQTEHELEKTIKEKNTLLSEVHHRVKNNLAIISGLIELEVMDADNEQIIRKLKDSQSRINSIALTHELLYQEQHFSDINYGDNVKKLVAQVTDTLGTEIEIRFDVDPLKLNINQALPCSLIINEIVTNAIKHAYRGIDEPELYVVVKDRDGTINLRIEDNGIGLPEGCDINSPNALGMQLINTLIKQLEADIEVTVEDGSSFEIWFKKQDVKGTGSSILNNIE